MPSQVTIVHSGSLGGQGHQYLILISQKIIEHKMFNSSVYFCLDIVSEKEQTIFKVGFMNSH